jgi:4-oxalocrotonate tautomerase
VTRKPWAKQRLALITDVSAAASAATGTPEDAFRVWIVEVDPAEVMAGGIVLADKRVAAI